jgi:uncharacterized repeat protein (TIGR02543 family)
MKKGISTIALVLLTVVSIGIQSKAYSQEEMKQKFYANEYIALTTDKGAYTILPNKQLAKTWNNKAKWSNQFEGISKKADIKRETGYEVNVNGQSDEITVPGKGQHNYGFTRNDVFPVDKWVVRHDKSQCIHGGYKGFHGLDVDLGAVNSICYSFYYDGWQPVCADCGKEIVLLHYTTEEAISSMDYIDGSLDYFWLCPYSLSNIEQGSGYNHICNKVSNNRYRIVYDKNSSSAGGWMLDSVHYWDNVSLYNGSTVIPQRNLSKNAFNWIGYVFTGWNTKSDGTGTAYVDGQTVANLTETENGTVTLYAQWRPSGSTLTIKPNGGKYLGVAEDTDRKGGTDIKLDILNSEVTNPVGNTVTFDGKTGTPAVNKIVQTVNFTGWTRSTGKGVLRDISNGVRYEFSAEDGVSEALTAQYKYNSIILPGISGGGYFVGWYDEYDNYAGMDGDSYTPSRDTKLHAVFNSINLITDTNYKVYSGSGAVNARWGLDVPQGKTYMYKLFQSAQYSGEMSKGSILTGGLMVPSADTVGKIPTVSKEWSAVGEREYTVPHTGIYDIESWGGQGQSATGQAGGKGGYVKTRTYLKAGQQLYLYTGNQGGGDEGSSNGTNGFGGQALVSDSFGTLVYNGGSASTVAFSDGTLIQMAAGGGGATTQTPGGDGGGSGSSTNGRNGADYGGGGGYYGGNGGIIEYHKHDESCYPVLPELGVVGTGYLHRSQWAFDNLKGNNDNGVIGVGGGPQHGRNVNNVTPDGPIAVGQHSAGGGGDGIEFHVRLGYLEPIPVEEREILYVEIFMDTWGHYYGEEEEWDDEFRSHGMEWGVSQVVVADGVTGEVIHAKRIISDGFRGKSYGISYDNNNEIHDSVIIAEFDVAGREGIEVRAVMQSEGHQNIEIRRVLFKEIRSNVPACGMNETTPIKSSSAVGGSSYISTDGSVVKSSSQQSGVREGNGLIKITSVQLGMQSDQKLDSIRSTDKAAPNKPVLDSKVTSASIKEVTWGNPGDNGTPYWFQVEAYDVNDYGATSNPPAKMRSNITKEILTSGVKDYVYAYEANKRDIATAVAQGQPGLGVRTQRSISLTASGSSDMWLSIAARDVAGNVGQTEYMRVARIGDDTVDEYEDKWPINTITVIMESTNGVYKKTGEISNTYFVKADGSTEYRIRFEGYMDGTPRSNYQIVSNYFQVLKNSSKIKEFKYTNDFITVDSKTISGDGVNTKGSESWGSGFESTGFREVIVSEKGGKSNVRGGFTASENGVTIEIRPFSSAFLKSIHGEAKDETVKSSEAQAEANALYLKCDGTAPSISGLDQFSGLGDRKSVVITASDGAGTYDSGINHIIAVVTNNDNKISREYKFEASSAVASGSVTIEVDGRNDPLFLGDVSVDVTAVDNVGNISKSNGSELVHGIESIVFNELGEETNTFTRGQSGVLSADVWGYHDSLTIRMKSEGKGSEWITLDNAFEKNKDYSENYTFNHSEQVQFTVPLDLPQDGEYEVVIEGIRGKGSGAIVDRSIEKLIIVRGEETEEVGRSTLD